MVCCVVLHTRAYSMAVEEVYIIGFIAAAISSELLK
jgi:hypothetical protein